MTLAEAQQKSLSLQPSLPQSRVRELLGDPDETSSRTYGSSTPNPWNGIEWVYKWHIPYQTKSLHVVFSDAAGDNNWVVNNWDWWDF